MEKWIRRISAWAAWACTSPIPGSQKLERLDENIGALAVEFTSGDLREIDSAISTMTIQGDRYPSNLQQLTNL